MMAGVKALRKIQLGRETTAGTATTASTMWRGLGSMEDTREVKFPEEDIGYLSGVDRTYVPKLEAKMELESVPATFEQLPYLLEMGVKAVGTGAADGSGSGKIYAYPLSTNAANTLAPYTVEAGDNQEAERAEYCFAQELKLSGKSKEALMMSATVIGRQVAPNTYSVGATLPSVEEILFNTGKLYIDAANGTAGSTLISNSFLGMEMSLKTGASPVYTADGNLYFTFVKLVQAEWSFDITFEHDAAGSARKVDWRAQTPRLIRVEFQGSSLTTAGTTYSKKTLQINFASKISKVAKLAEIDGNDVLKVTFKPRYNTTAAVFGSFIVVNQLATLP